ncbi:MAG: DUF6265 family protein [Bacteroidia bacterium]
MKYILLFTSILFLHCQSSRQLTSANKQFKALHVLLGDWQTPENKEDKSKITYEIWQKANDSTLKGQGFTLKNAKDTVFFEHLQLTLRKGKINYVVTARGQNDEQAISFALTKANSQDFSFENPAHDFPQKITYHLPNHKTILAKVEGGGEGFELRLERKR